MTSTRLGRKASAYAPTDAVLTCARYCGALNGRVRRHRHGQVALRGDKTRGAVEKLESLRWHILRLDGFRAGLWNRAGIILSANALVTAASAVLISVGSRAGHLTLITAVLAMVAVLVSVYEAMGVGGARRQWLGSYEDKQSPPAFVYAVSETMRVIQAVL